MKFVTLALAMLFLGACSQQDIEEMLVKKTIEYSLIELCGEQNEACIEAVETQVSACIEKNNITIDTLNVEDEQQLQNVVTEFYTCIVDENGDPMFENEQAQ